MKKFCLALDLIDDIVMIEEYEQWHKKVAPEIKASIRDAGITNMELYRTGNRLFMIMETEDNFSFEQKEQMDTANEKVQVWENLMSTYQRPLPWAKQGEKWLLMQNIFELNK